MSSSCRAVVMVVSAALLSYATLLATDAPFLLSGGL
jgi:hypothetical protein